MNCDQAREQLVDLIYGELTADQQAQLQAHLADCPACRSELDKLSRARKALGQAAMTQPADLPPVALPFDQKTPPPAKAILRFPSRRWLSVSAAAAAVLLVACAFWLFHNTTTTEVFAADKIEIQRQNVSLTILSQPENWPGDPDYQNLNQAAQMQQRLVPSEESPQFGWRGMALVRDQRLIRNIAKGEARVEFTDVPTGILADSVSLKATEDPLGLKILEQNYQYDLASAAAILQKYIDQPIAATLKDQSKVQGRLLSFDEQNLVIDTAISPTVRFTAKSEKEKADATIRTVVRKQIKSIAFEKLPDGLLTRPTLLWKLQNTAASRQQFEVAYLTKGITWRADYVLKLHPAKRQPQTQDAKGNITDTGDLVGYATVTNNSGVTYADAQLKLLAGDVNLIRPPMVDHYLWDGDGRHQSEFLGRSRGFQEKSFFEYHLYTLGRPSTIRDRETKQIELTAGNGLKMARTYVYDPQVNPNTPRVVSELENSKANGLGVPLPKGVVRLYAPDPDGVDQYVSNATIDHTPVNEKLRLPWSYAFDIACSTRTTVREVRGNDVHTGLEYVIRNHKSYDVTVTAIVHVPPSTYQLEVKDSRPWHIREVGWIEIPVTIAANGEQTLNVDYRDNAQSGGGLKEPKHLSQ